MKETAMTAANLTTVLKGSVENSRKIGHHLVRAYDAGNRRMLHTVDRGFTKLLARPPIVLRDPLRTQVKATGKQVVELANGGVKMSAATAVKAIDSVCDGSEAVLGGIHVRVQRIENPYATRAVGWLADAGLPAAELSRKFTEQMAHRTAKLAVAAAGPKPRFATPRRRKPRAKKARR
jgi:hypothetical protein